MYYKYYAVQLKYCLQIIQIKYCTYTIDNSIEIRLYFMLITMGGNF